MKFKLYKPTESAFSALEQLLYNRGIPLEQQQDWLNASWESINDWKLLDENKIRKVIRSLEYNIKSKQNILFVVD